VHKENGCWCSRALAQKSSEPDSLFYQIGMTPASIGGEQLACISGGSQSPSDMPPADDRRAERKIAKISLSFRAMD